MSEKLLKFLLSELKTVRVICKNSVCGGIVEVPIEQLGKMYKKAACPLCQTSYTRDPRIVFNPLADLAKAVQDVAALHDLFDVEFVLPDAK